MTKAAATICLLAASTLACAQWNACPWWNNPLAAAAYDQQDAKIVSDSKSGAIVAWLDYRANALMTSGDIYAQRIDRDGVVKWTLNGIAVCNDTADQVGPVIEEDGAGGAIIVWEDMRNGSKDIYAQRIDSSGNIVWTVNGVPLAVKPGLQVNPRLTSDGAGGAFVVWEDDSLALGDENIFVQHIGAGGAVSFGPNGYPVCKAGFAQINPRIVSDGFGGAVICWQDKRNGSDYDIYAQRVNSSGVSQWAANGVGLCLLAETQSNPKMVPDQAGGAIIAWQDKRTSLGFDIYGQYVNISGIAQWTTGGKVICNAAGNQSAIDMTTDGAIAGAIIAWKDGRNGSSDIYGQKISFAGITQWTANGLAICTSANDQVNPNVIPDAGGGGIVVWQDSLTGNYDIRAQRVGSAGAPLWTAGGVDIGTASLNQTNPKNVGDGSGGSIYCFQDKRSADFDVYAFRTDASGTPVSIPELAGGPATAVVYPNPSRDKLTIRCDEFDNGFCISVFDVLGSRLLQETSRGSTFELGGKLCAGVYYFKLNAKERHVGGKFIIEN